PDRGILAPDSARARPESRGAVDAVRRHGSTIVQGVSPKKEPSRPCRSRPGAAVARVIAGHQTHDPAEPEDLRYFLSIHPLELYTSLNRDFFKGTSVEKAADEFLGSRE
ncbi:hypothetical protein VF10_37860, partial [Nostoc linckia z13]